MGGCGLEFGRKGCGGGCCVIIGFFFFQAEGGIRDHCVTGVQTCALPISCIIVSVFSVHKRDEITYSLEESSQTFTSELSDTFP